MKQELASKIDLECVKTELVMPDQLDRVRDELTKLLNNLSIKISDMESNRRQVGSDLTYIRSLFLEKADLREMKAVEQKL